MRTYNVKIENNGELIATCELKAINQVTATKFANAWKRRENHKGVTTVARDWSKRID
jgi:hypothetical protein